MSIERWNEKASLIWSVADLLRGPYRPNQYKDVMLPMLVLRRLDCVLAPTKEAVLAKNADLQQRGRTQNAELVLNEITGHRFHNTSKFTFEKLKGEPDTIAENLVDYLAGFSKQAKEILEHFGFEEQIAKLDKADRLFLIVSRFCEVDLHPSKVSNREMGYLFEELIRRFNEASNEEAGDHFTPREVIRLMVNLLFAEDDAALTTPGIIRTLYDPACGTGGMLSVAEEYVEELNPEAELKVFGQDYNDQAYAICGSDLLIKGQDPGNVHFGDSFTDDHFRGQRFDYMLANPPFGVEWKPQEAAIKKEREEKGYAGRFGAGLPPINDGSLLFLQHMIAKMKDPAREGSRIGIVFNGSPLFSGSAGSGPSDIRKWIIENDWLEGIVAMPDQLFYNTGIATYVWVVTNRKAPGREGKVRLVDGRTFYRKMRKSLGNKRNEIGEDQCRDLVRLYSAFEENEHVRVFGNEDFGYRRVTVERPLRLTFAVTDERLARVQEAPAFANLAGSRKRKDAALIAAEEEAGREQQAAILAALETLRPLGIVRSSDEFAATLKAAFRAQRLAVPASIYKAVLAALSERDETAEVCRDAGGNPEPDPELRDFENVPLKDDVADYLEREVLPHAPDAWVDESKTKVGYEINFNRYFYRYTPPRPLEAIEAEIRDVEREIADLLAEMT